MRPRSCRRLAGSLLLLAAGVGCTGTHEALFVSRGDGGLACPGGTAGRPLAEWRANGNTRDEQSCPPWRAEIVGQVPYGPGREGQAWQFRSQAMDGSDPDYVAVPGSAGHVYRSLTVDAWVQQIGFNAYHGSDRVIVGTGPGFGQRPGSWMLYVHEDTSVDFYVRAAEGVAGSATCGATGPNSPTPTPRDVWVRYTATYDGQTLRCYRDGSPTEPARLPAGAPPEPADALQIGRSYPGDIDALRVFDVALSDAEIARPWP